MILAAYSLIGVIFSMGMYLVLAGNFHAISPLLAATFSFIMALFVYSRGRNNPVNRTFAVFASCLGLFHLNVFGYYIIPDAADVRLWARTMRVGFVFMPSMFMHFILRFVRNTDRKRTKHLLMMHATGFVFLVLNWVGYFESGFVWTGRKYSPVGGMYYLFLVYVLFVCLYGIAVLYKTYRNSPASSFRNQVAYVLFAGVAGTALGFSNTLLSLGVRVYPLGWISAVTFAGIIAYAIIKHQLMDITVIIRKGIIYGTLTASIAGIYVCIVGLLYAVFGITRVVQGSLIINALVGTLIATVFLPLRNAIQRAVDRLFFKDKYDYRKTLISFSRHLTSIIELDTLLSVLLTKVMETMHIDKGYVMLLDEKKEQFEVKSAKGAEQGTVGKFILSCSDGIVSLVKEYKRALLLDEVEEDTLRRLKEQKIFLLVPLITQDRLTGILCLGSKLSEDRYTPDDIGLLTTVANQAAVAIENAALSAHMRTLEKSLHQMDKLSALGTFASSVAHEIKNPLASIKTFCHLVARRSDDQKFIEKFNTIVPGEIVRLESILNQLLNFGKFSEGNVVPVRTERVIDELLNLLQYEAFKYNVRIVKEYAGRETPPVMGVEEHLKQVYMNLVLNAIQAMPQGGELRIATHVRKCDDGAECVCISFGDTGGGIPDEVRSKLFRPFVTTKENGSGLGLSIIHRIIREHGGTIDVESEAGMGTVFRVTLPVEDQREISGAMKVTEKAYQ